MLRALEFAIGQALTNIRRHGLMSIAATSTVAVALCIVGAAGLTLLNVNAWTRGVAGEVEAQVYVQRSVSRADALALQRRIRQLPHVEATHFVPREEGLRDMQQAMGSDRKLFEGLGNPLPDMIRVRAEDPSYVEAIAATVRSWPEIETVVASEQTVRVLLTVRRVVSWGSLVGGVLLILAALLIVHNAIRLTLIARRREIGIMQLVGATPTFIAAPFIFEGAFHGVVGALLALGLLVPGYIWARGFLTRVLPLLPVAPLGVLVDCGVLLVVAGLAIACAGSTASLVRFLRRYHAV